MNTHYDTEFAVAIALAESAGEQMRQFFGFGAEFTRKEDGSLLTAVDTAINTEVEETIKAAFPADGVLGEELGLRSGTNNRCWVVDPIDGTSNFATGIPLTMFSLALTVDGESVVAVCYDPMMKRMFTARKGQGTYLNGVRAAVSKDDIISRSAVHHELPVKLPSYLPLLQFLREHKSKGSSLSCSTYGACLVATGAFIGSINTTPKAWDMAAVSLLVQEAGGVATDVYGNAQRYDQPIRGCVLSNGKVHQQLLELLDMPTSYYA
jgi:myo-inositol-1(or 4)-monophosphatase